MISDSYFDNSKEIDKTTEYSQHLQTFQNKILQFKPSKEISELEINQENLKNKLESNQAFLNESVFNFPSGINLQLNYHYPFDCIEENESPNNFNEKITESFSKKNQRTNVNFKTRIEKKLKKNKMYNFLFFLSTIFALKNFIEKLRNLSFLRSPSRLKKFQFNLIGDKSYIEKEQTNFALEYLNKIFGEKLWIFDPSKNFSIVFDFVVLLTLSYYFLMIPLHFTYQSFAMNPLKMEFDLIAFYILLIDILKTFNTAIYLKGKLVHSRIQIVCQYLKQDFLFDFISLAPAIILFIDIYNSNYQYFLLLFYLKIKNFKIIITRLEQLLLSNRKFHHSLSLIKLIVWIIFLTHSFACIWNGIGLVGDKYFEKTWLKEKNLDHSEMMNQYLFSYYFVCVTMNTVGFGDIAPTNKLEVCFCIVFIFLACGIFAYSINSIGIILTDISKEQNEYRKDLNTINDFMKKKKISFDLRMRIRKYLEYIKIENGLHEDKETEKTINKLSDSLREELLLEANGSILKKINFFSLHFSEETLRRTIMIMKEKKFTPGDIIFERGDCNESILYIIKTGEVELLLGNSTHIFKKGDTFGELAFFSGQEQRFSARSLDFTTTFAIDKNEFISIIAKVTHDFEKFNELKQRLSLYNDTSVLHSSCLSCYKLSHRIDKCPILHYCPKKEIILDRFLYNYTQERGDYKRRKMFKKKNSLINKRKNLIKALLFQEEKSCSSFCDIVSEREDKQDENEKASEDSDSLAKFEHHKMQSFESSESQKGKSESSIKLRKTKEIVKEESSYFDFDNGKYSSKLALIKNEEKTSFNRLNSGYSMTPNNNHFHNKFFNMIDFDKIGFFANYFPNNDVELILEKIELKRVNILKRIYSKRLNSSFNSSPRFQNYINMHQIDGTFVQGKSIKINQKAAMVNFNENQKKREISRRATRQLNLKKKFFKRIEESPEEIIKNYFRTKLRQNKHSFKKTLRNILKKIKVCL